MPIDLKTETIIPLSQGKRHLVLKPSYHKLLRWANVGIISRGGRRTFLEVIKIGGELCTSQEAFVRFCNELTEDDLIGDDMEQSEYPDQE